MLVSLEKWKNFINIFLEKTVFPKSIPMKFGIFGIFKIPIDINKLSRIHVTFLKCLHLCILSGQKFFSIFLFLVDFYVILILNVRTIFQKIYFYNFNNCKLLGNVLF